VIRALVDALYGTSGAVARFERAHPGERVIFAGATKAVRTPSEQPVQHLAVRAVAAAGLVWWVGRQFAWW
jgi:hypothetical protein